MQNRTVIVIAHRLSTVRDADVIAVCGEGRVLDSGPHELLMRTSPVYLNLVRKQLPWGDSFLDQQKQMQETQSQTNQPIEHFIVHDFVESVEEIMSSLV